jgi:hypothetical protein
VSRGERLCGWVSAWGSASPTPLLASGDWERLVRREADQSLAKRSALPVPAYFVRHGK